MISKCNDVDYDLHPPEGRAAFGEIAQTRGDARLQKKDRDGGGLSKIPKNQPVAALEIGVGFGALIRGDGIEPGLRGCGGIERTGIVRRDD